MATKSGILVENQYQMSKDRTNFSSLNSAARILVFMLIFLLPLVFCTEFQTVFTVPKLLLFRVAALLIFTILLFKSFRDSSVKLPSAPFVAAISAVLFAALLSAFFSINHFTALFGQYGRFMGFFGIATFALFAVAASGLFTESKHSLMALRLTVLTTLLVSIYGLLQYFDLLPFATNWSDNPTQRVFASIGHGNHLGAWLAGQIFAAAALFIAAGEHKKKTTKIVCKVISLTSLFLALITLYLTASRAAALTFLSVAAIMSVLHAKKIHGFWLLKKAHSEKNKPLRKWLLALLITFCLLATSWTFWPQISQSGMVQRTVLNLQGIESGVIPERISFLRSAWDIFLTNPLTGSGPDTFRDAYSAHRRPDYIVFGVGNAQNITVPESSHNLIADLLSNQGIVGLAAFVFFVYTVLAAAFKQIREKTLSPAVWAFLAMFLAFLIETMFSFGDVTNTFTFWLAAAIIIGSAGHSGVTFPLRKYAKYLLTLLMLILLTLFAVDHVWNLGKSDLLQKQAKKQEAALMPISAEKSWLQAISSYPYEYSLHQSLADLSLKTAVLSTDADIKKDYLSRAIFHYGNAIQLNNFYSSTHHNLALAHLYSFRLTADQSHQSLAQENYLLAIAKSPRNPRYYYEYARKLHSDFDDRAGAVDYLQQALQINPQYQEPLDYLNFLYQNHPELRQ